MSSASSSSKTSPLENRPENNGHTTKQPKIQRVERSAIDVNTFRTIPLLDSARVEPILLVEGDVYHLSREGIARSFYQLIDRNDESKINSSSIAVEEYYDIERSCKSFLVRETPPKENVHHSKQGMVTLGRLLSTISSPLTVQEIPGSVVGSISNDENPCSWTGTRTWDSSIAMSMFFGTRPELMLGRCIEVGSGVGLGGILSYSLRMSSMASAPFQSLTLTDYNEKVMDQCRENILRLCSRTAPSIYTERLDWYDFLSETGSFQKYAGGYDTVIACDCAYVYPDVLALARTLLGLLRKSDSSRCYIFAPANRGAVEVLIRTLRKENDCHVVVQDLRMIRYRLEAPNQTDASNVTFRDGDDWLLNTSTLGRHESRCNFSSMTDCIHIVITVSLRVGGSETIMKDDSMSDVD